MQFQSPAKPPVGIVFDADLGNTIDDALALAMLFGFQGKNESRVLSVSTTKSSLAAAIFADVLVRFYTGEPGPFAPGRTQRKIACLVLEGAAARVLLPAAAITAAAQAAVRHHAVVPWLPRDAKTAAVQLAAQHEPGANTGAHGDEHHMVLAAGRAEPELGPDARVGVVLDHHRKTHEVGNLLADRLVPPGKVGREQHTAPFLVHVPGRAQADRFHLVTGLQFANHLNDHPRGARRAGRRRGPLQLLDDPAIGVDDPARDLGTSYINADRQAHAVVLLPGLKPRPPIPHGRWRGNQHRLVSRWRVNERRPVPHWRVNERRPVPHWRVNERRPVPHWRPNRRPAPHFPANRRPAPHCPAAQSLPSPPGGRRPLPPRTPTLRPAPPWRAHHWPPPRATPGRGPTRSAAGRT